MGWGRAQKTSKDGKSPWMDEVWGDADQWRFLDKEWLAHRNCLTEIQRGGTLLLEVFCRDCSVVVVSLRKRP